MPHLRTPRKRDDWIAFCLMIKWLMPFASNLFGMVFVLLLVAAGAALHAGEGTLAQRRACEPDVFRLCNEFIPDHAAITNCLQRNKPRLNSACRVVFEGNDGAGGGHLSMQNKLKR